MTTEKSAMLVCSQANKSKNTQEIMTATMLATNASAIGKRVNVLIAGATRHISASEFGYRRLLVEATKVVNVAPGLGHATVALVKHLSGDLDGVTDELNKASRAGAHPQEVADTAMTCYVNLGMFSLAGRYYVQAADPRNGSFSDVHEVGIACGLFRTLKEYYELASRMKIDLSPFLLRTRCLQAADLLERTGTTDEEVTALLDIAGEIMREKRLFYMGRLPEFTVLDDDETEHCVFLTFAVGETPEVVSDMMFELASRAADRLPRIPPGFSVGFSASAS